VGLSLENTFDWLGNFILPDIGSYPKGMPEEYNFRVVVRQNGQNEHQGGNNKQKRLPTRQVQKHL
jgi:hypothetical protein